MKKETEAKFNELINRVPFSSDDYWVYFGYGDNWDDDKCNRCYENIKKEKMPNSECINCWKFEIWTDNLTNLEETMLFLLEESDRDHTLSGKLSVGKPLMYEEKGDRLGTGNSHTIPEDAKPDRYLRGEIDCDGVILIYNQSIEERDMRMNRILKGLKERGLYKKDSFPYRRGCIEPHEKLIGPWENWFDMNKDYIL